MLQDDGQLEVPRVADHKRAPASTVATSIPPTASETFVVAFTSAAPEPHSLAASGRAEQPAAAGAGVPSTTF